MTPEQQKQLAFASRAVYYAPEAATQSLNAPIYMSSSFQYDADSYQRVVDGERKAVNIYGRCGNPSEYQFEEQMMQIHGADACLATASGMAAITVALFGLLKSGDHIVCDWTTYSSTHEMLDQSSWIWESLTTDDGDASWYALEAAVAETPKDQPEADPAADE